MAEILQLTHLVQHDRMADVDVGRGRIEPELDAQRLAARGAPRELLCEFVFDQQLVTPRLAMASAACTSSVRGKVFAAEAGESFGSVVMLATFRVIYSGR